MAKVLEKRLNDQIDRFIRAGGVVHQINYYETREDQIVKVGQDARHIPESSGYHLTAVLGRNFGPLYFDILIAGKKALLTTSENANLPSIAGSAFFFEDIRSIGFLTDVFRSISGRSSAYALREGKKVREDNIASIEDIIRKQSLSPISAASGIDAAYKTALKMIDNAPDGSEICLTELRKLDVLYSQVDEYGKKRDERISEGKNCFRRVVALCNEKDLEGLYIHLEGLKNSNGNNYELRVLRGTEETSRDQPYFDMLLVKEGQALLQIPCAQGGVSGILTSHETAKDLSIYFDELWGEATEIKKASDEIDDDFLADLRKRVESIPVHSWFAHPLHEGVIEQQHLPRLTSVTTLLPRENSYASMLDDLRQAKDSLFIISYYKLLTGTISRRDRYFDEVWAAIERGVHHCRIVWNHDHLQWLEERFDQGWDKLSNFQVRFLPQEKGQDLTTFDLIDERVVLMGQGWQGSGHIRIKNVEAARFFRTYFARKWERAKQYPIKEAGKPPDMELLARLKEISEE